MGDGSISVDDMYVSTRIYFLRLMMMDAKQKCNKNKLGLSCAKLSSSRG
jgi:hypothetical protein